MSNSPTTTRRRCPNGHTVSEAFCGECGAKAVSEVQAAPARTTSVPVPSLWSQRFRRSFSIRVQMFCFLTAVLAGGLASKVWEPLAWLTWPVYGLLFLSAVFNDGNVIECPFCRKRVKIGAGACHHCGRDVRPPA